MTKHLIILVGPPGSGKTTLAKDYETKGYVRVSQDDQGKSHQHLFIENLKLENNLIIDRMNFNKKQREFFITHGIANNYTIEVIILHESFETCMNRMLSRDNHPTIKNKENASRALNFFFKAYERPEYSENVHKITRLWPTFNYNPCIVVDLDGTLANVKHRRHFVQGEKKDWKNFFASMINDEVNTWCEHIVNNSDAKIVISSGRPDNYRHITTEWLDNNDIIYNHLFMRPRNDMRQDNIVKEIILEFEIKTRYNILFALDDRKQVIDMLRQHGIVVLDCAGEKGNF